MGPYLASPNKDKHEEDDQTDKVSCVLISNDYILEALNPTS